jgi:mono/diheme cytochrome c family protein
VKWGAVIAALMAVHASLAAAEPVGFHFANADDPALIATGRSIYKRNCGSCHGMRLEGQALWRLQDQYAGRRAPPHDATGHTWQHSDEALFEKTKFGRFPGEPPKPATYMPAFAGYLSDHEILAILAFIKSDWPTGIRASQAMLNPGQAGMPKGADKDSWTLPPNCTGTFLLWEGANK